MVPVVFKINFWRLQALLPRHQWRSLMKFAGLFSLCLALVVGCAGNDQQTPDPQAVASAETSNGRISMGTTLTARTLDPAGSYEIIPGILLNNSWGINLLHLRTGHHGF